MNIKFSYIPAILVCLPLFGCGPSNFNDCVLHNLRGINNEEVMQAIVLSCRKKFPSVSKLSSCSSKSLEASEFNKIRGSSKITDIGKPYFSFDLYNGLSDTSIEGINVSISADNIQPPQEYVLHIQDPIRPKTAGTAGSTIQSFPLKNFEWHIVSVKVCSK